MDIEETSPRAMRKAHGFWRPVACPHCGKSHTWTSHLQDLAQEALDASPEAARVLVDGDVARALP
jgi:sirohydrochlorin ferrochelatase